MIGLWARHDAGSASISAICDGSFIAQLLASGKRLAASGIACQNFLVEKRPNLRVGWMPSAQLYFRDPDGHSVEFITLLDDAPDPDFIGSLSAWQRADETRWFTGTCPFCRTARRRRQHLWGNRVSLNVMANSGI